MKRSTAALFLGTVVGMPAFFIEVGDLPVAAQIGWAATVIACGIAGGALCAFERHDLEEAQETKA